MNDFIEMTKEFVEELEQPESKSRVETYNSFYRSSDDKSTSAWSVFYSSVCSVISSQSRSLCTVFFWPIYWYQPRAKGRGTFTLNHRIIISWTVNSTHQFIDENCSYLMWICLRIEGYEFQIYFLCVLTRICSKKVVSMWDYFNWVSLNYFKNKNWFLYMCDLDFICFFYFLFFTIRMFIWVRLAVRQSHTTLANYFKYSSRVVTRICSKMFCIIG